MSTGRDSNISSQHGWSGRLTINRRAKRNAHTVTGRAAATRARGAKQRNAREGHQIRSSCRVERVQSTGLPCRPRQARGYGHCGLPRAPCVVTALVDADDDPHSPIAPRRFAPRLGLQPTALGMRLLPPHAPCNLSTDTLCCLPSSTARISPPAGRTCTSGCAGRRRKSCPPARAKRPCDSP